VFFIEFIINLVLKYIIYIKVIKFHNLFHKFINLRAGPDKILISKLLMKHNVLKPLPMLNKK